MNCTTCKTQIDAIGGVAQHADAIETAKTFFEGPDYCSKAGAADPEGCKKFVESFIPKALPALGYSMQLASEALCKVVYNLC